MKKIAKFALTAALTAQLLSTVVFAGNPNTGDESVWLMGLMIGALVISGGLIVAFLIMGKKSK